MNARQRTLSFMALGHLVLAALGAAGLGPGRIPGVGTVLRNYSAFSGANSQFGFFAPNVGGDLRATFTLSDGGNRPRTVRLQGRSHEADLRIGNTIGILWDQVTDETVRRSLVASWTAKAISGQTGVREVLAQIESYELPTLERYGNGDRPYWRPFYSAKFVLGKNR